MLPELLLITNEPKQARAWDAAGVDIIFVDLEVAGKHERQGHLNTVISNHAVEDVSLIKRVLLKSKLLVRINPMNRATRSEVDEVIERGAEIIMLPMFKSADEVKLLVDMVAGRCDIYPLIETPQALNDIENLAVIDAVSGYHFGLNDLHLALGMSFMFEVMTTPEFDDAINVLKKHKKPFGVGGVTRIGGGALPAELVVRENYRLGSQRMILSRSFKSEVDNENYSVEISAIKEIYVGSKYEDLEKNRINFFTSITKFVENINA